jgi:hypothetical protein
MTSAVDKRGSEVSPKFRVLLTASLVPPLIMFDSSIVAISPPSLESANWPQTMKVTDDSVIAG